MRIGIEGGGPRYAESAELGVWVLVADAPLEGPHGLLGGDGLGPNDIGNFEIQGDVLSAYLLALGGGRRELL